MGHKYVVLGAGRQGVAAAYDLAVFGQADSLVLLDIDLAVAQAGADKLNGLLGKPIASAFRVDAGDVVDRGARTSTARRASSARSTTSSTSR